jgi:Mg-chelatase subunit ChlI
MPTETAIRPIEIKNDEKVLQQCTNLVEQAKELKITNDLACSQAVELAKTIKAFIEGPGTYHDEEIEMANRLHKQLCSKRNAILDPAKAAYKAIKDAVALYQWEQQKKHEEEQRKAEAEARRKEDEKRQKLLDKAAAEDAAGNTEKAEQLLEKAEEVYVPAKAVPTVAAPAGASMKFTWDPEVFNKAEVPDAYKTVDLAALRKAQEAVKGELVVPGVRFTKRPIGSIRK